MPSVTAQTFTDPYQYQAFTCDAEHRVIVTGRGEYQAKTVRLDLQRVRLRRAWQSLPSISHLAIPAGRSAICFPLNAHESPAVWGGGEVSAGEIFVVSSGGDFYSRTDKGGHWASISMASDVLAEYTQNFEGTHLTFSNQAYLRPSSGAMLRLHALHRAAGDLAEHAPETFARLEVTKVIEHELMKAVIDCLTSHPASEMRSYRRRPIMRRFEDFLEANPGLPLHVFDVCSAIGASERTLRAHCLAHLGISPHRYLWLRRMHQVRHALSLANAATQTVTDIATEYGFWELGRFAVTYRKLFGERPSATLHHSTF